MFLEEGQGPCPKAVLLSLDSSSPASLMSNCLDLPFGTSSRLKFVPQKQERGGRRKAHVPESPQGPAWFPRVGLERDEMGPSDFPPGEEEVKNTKTAERLLLFRGRILRWNGLGSGLGC